MSHRRLTATSRLKKDYMRLKRDPVPYITAEPLPSNILEWHYVVKGPEDSPYHGGYYHGTLHFAKEYPFKPPSIYMLTPNGRFKTNTRLCLSISDFHPDTWNPAWSVSTILTGLLSFMLETTPTLGSTESTAFEKQQYARQSLAFNLKNANFRELFPEICDEMSSYLRATTSSSSNGMHLSNGVNQIPNGNCDVDGNGNAGSETLNSNDLNSAGRHNSNSANHQNNSFCNWNAICSNLIVIISFALFALIVNYVIKSINQD